MRLAASLFLFAFFGLQTVGASPITPTSLIPETGPYGSFAVLFSPDEMPGVADAAAADYLRPDGRRLGALLVANTTSSFDADFIRAAFVGGSIVARSSRVMAGGAFDVVTLLREDGAEVFSIGFVAHFADGLVMVDGSALFPVPAGEGALSVLAWAESEEAAALLVASSLELVALMQPLGFAQEAPFTEANLAAPSAYPNPFTESSTIGVTLDEAAHVELAVFDALGRRVALLASGPLEAGSHRFALEGNDRTAGVYLARLVVDGRMSTSRITRMR